MLTTRHPEHMPTPLSGLAWTPISLASSRGPTYPCFILTPDPHSGRYSTLSSPCCRSQPTWPNRQAVFRSLFQRAQCSCSPLMAPEYSVGTYASLFASISPQVPTYLTQPVSLGSWEESLTWFFSTLKVSLAITQDEQIPTAGMRPPWHEWHQRLHGKTC